MGPSGLIHNGGQVDMAAFFAAHEAKLQQKGVFKKILKAMKELKF